MGIIPGLLRKRRSGDPAASFFAKSAKKGLLRQNPAIAPVIKKGTVLPVPEDMNFIETHFDSENIAV